MSVGRAAAAASVLAILVATIGVAPPATRAATGIKPQAEECVAVVPDVVAEADRIMARHLQLGTFPAVTLPVDPTWRERPFNADHNWLFNYHSLRWILPLLQAGRETGDSAYTARAAFLLKDWLAANPWSPKATVMSWNDMTTGFRASVLACATRDLGFPSWLVTGLKGHGVALADTSFYAEHGNHALNQVIGFLDVACVLGNASWKSLAVRRFTALVAESVDKDGVSNEQSIGYQLYNYEHYERARRHMTACHLSVPAAFARIAKMPDFLAYATDPDGYYAQLGDTDLQEAKPIPGTATEYASTGGLGGVRPSATLKRYAAGYYFARSGWGETRPFEQETYITYRFGPGVGYHGHPDGQSITLSAKGRRLVVDPGKYTYTEGPWKIWFQSRAAHNVVLVDGLPFNETLATGFGSLTRPEALYTAMTNRGYAGVTNTRRVVWSRTSDYLIVDDALSSSVARTYRQTWHLARGSSPTIAGNRLDTHFGAGNLAIVQLIGRPTMRIVSGTTKPIQGWVSETYNVKFRAPVLQSTIKAKKARYLTLLVPYAGAKPVIKAHVVNLTSAGYAVDVTIGTRTERIVVGPGAVTVTRTAASTKGR